MTYPYAIRSADRPSYESQLPLYMDIQLHTQTALLTSQSNSTCSTFQTVLHGQNLVLATVCTHLHR